jgi:hypothetical protein
VVFLVANEAGFTTGSNMSLNRAIYDLTVPQQLPDQQFDPAQSERQRRVVLFP